MEYWKWIVGVLVLAFLVTSIFSGMTGYSAPEDDEQVRCNLRETIMDIDLNHICAGSKKGLLRRLEALIEEVRELPEEEFEKEGAIYLTSGAIIDVSK